MALLKSHHQAKADSGQYVFDDYEQKKVEYLKKIEGQAKVILDNAKEKARVVIADAYKVGIEKANTEIEKQKEIAKTEGLQEGIALGKDEAKKENENYIQTNMIPMVERLKKMCSEYEATVKNVEEFAGNEIQKTAVSLAKSLLLVEPQYNKEVLSERIKEAISYLKVDMELSVKVNPDDKAHAQEHFAAVLDQLGVEPKLIWKEDENLNKGDIKVNSGESQVKLYSQEQWKSILEALKVEDPS